MCRSRPLRPNPGDMKCNIITSAFFQLLIIALTHGALTRHDFGSHARDGIQTMESPLKAPPPPVWPSMFEMQYTVEMPYIQMVQLAGLRIPIHVWYDSPGKMMRMDVYGGLDSTYTLPDFTFNTFPRILTKECMKIDNTAGPTLALLGTEANGGHPLPDLSAWQFSGAAKMPSGMLSFVWTLTDNHEQKTNTYTFYTAQEDGRPLKLYMTGVNLLEGSHFDEYVLDFQFYSDHLFPGSNNVFKPPPLCDSVDAEEQQRTYGAGAAAAVVAQSRALLPSNLAGGHPAVRSVAAVAEALQRTEVGSGFGEATQQEAQDDVSAAALPHLARNRLFIESWNKERAATSGFKLALNRFAALPHVQFLATSLGHSPSRKPSSQGLLGRTRKAAPGGGGYLGTFKRQLQDTDLPASVDYRGTGADGVVKDQAFCGSCWSFATTGTMTGTWFKATGQVLSLSEQHLVDCAWDHKVSGCWGGEGEPAMEFIIADGGAVMEDDYPYMGENGYCKSNQTTKAAMFSGYVTIPTGDEGALMEALATNGPLYVALDADDPTFKFYSEGVYHRDNCGTARDELDHAVTLVGYGTTEQGVDYWLIRNSWSKLWGEDGYIKITRKGNDCGITTAAVQAVVDKEAGMRAKRLVEAQQLRK